jgi:replicative DNA helicase
MASCAPSARRLARICGGKLGLIVVDYLQLMSGTASSGENRATELGEISRGLKALAKELGLPGDRAVAAVARWRSAATSAR